MLCIQFSLPLSSCVVARFITFNKRMGDGAIGADDHENPVFFYVVLLVHIHSFFYQNHDFLLIAEVANDAALLLYDLNCSFSGSSYSSGNGF